MKAEVESKYTGMKLCMFKIYVLFELSVIFIGELNTHL